VAMRAACRQRGELVTEHLLLRHQLAVLTRPTRRRRRVRFRRMYKLLWVLVRRLRRDWRRHLVVVTPETVLRWRRAGWRSAPSEPPAGGAPGLDQAGPGPRCRKNVRAPKAVRSSPVAPHEGPTPRRRGMRPVTLRRA
jgi:hypothetical protein